MKTLCIERMEQVEGGSCKMGLMSAGISYVAWGVGFGVLAATTGPIGVAAMASFWIGTGATVVSGATAVASCT